METQNEQRMGPDSNFRLRKVSLNRILQWELTSTNLGHRNDLVQGN